jgi:hypothetical protein
MVTLPAYIEEPPRQPLTLAAGLRRVVSFPILLGALLVAGGFSVAKLNILDPDTWWHIAVGQRILLTHSWPRIDLYSSTVPGTPWMAYEWLGEVVMGAAASLGGLWSSTLLLVVLAAVMLLLLYYYAHLRCANSKGAFVACVTLLPTIGAFFTLRPQLFGAVFLVITLILLERFRQGRPRALWFLPLLFLCWVNTHGSFVFGFLVLGVTWLSGQVEFSAGGLFAERWTKKQSLQLALVLLLCVLVLPITPYGTRLAAYPLIMALSQPVNVNNIQEWQPLGTELLLGKMFLVVALLFFLASLVQRPKFRLAEIVLALFGVYAACVHLRFILLFVILFVPLWAMLLSRWVPGYRPDGDHPLVNTGLIAVIAVVLVYFFPSNRELDRRIENEYPQSALQYLINHPVPGRLMNDYGWGGYLIWAAGPQYKVFIDGRADIYEYGGVLADYLSIVRLEPNALRLLKKYDVEACLIPHDAPLGTALAAMPGWERVYQDHVAAIYVHKPKTTAPIKFPPEPKATPDLAVGVR